MSTFFDLVKNKVDILHIIRRFITLKPHGKEYFGLCPFHSEKTPSFKVNTFKNFFYCFGCNAGGDVISFYAKINNQSYKIASLELAKMFNIPLPQLSEQQKHEERTKKKISNFLEDLNSHFINNLKKDQKYLQYLYDRDIDANTIANHELGLAKNDLTKIFYNSIQELVGAGLLGKNDNGDMYEIFKNRILIPIRNKYNNLIGFGGRCIDMRLPKYLNSPETQLFKKGQSLYGENISYQACYKLNYVFLVEGYFDCIMMHKNNFFNTVASLGTAVTIDHLDKIWNHVEEVIICMDSDNAGQKAADRIIQLAIKKINSNNKISFLQLPKDDDPDSFLRKNGVANFQKLISMRKNLSEIAWEMNIRDKCITSAEAFAKLESDLKIFCNQITDDTLRSNFLKFYKTKSWELYRKHTKKNKFSVKISKIHLQHQNLSNESNLDVSTSELDQYLQQCKILEITMLFDLVNSIKTIQKFLLANLNTKFQTINQEEMIYRLQKFIFDFFHTFDFKIFKSFKLYFIEKYNAFEQVLMRHNWMEEVISEVQNFLSTQNLNKNLQAEASAIKLENLLNKCQNLQNLIDKIEQNLQILILKYEILTLEYKYQEISDKKLQNMDLIKLYVDKILEKRDELNSYSSF